MTSVSVKFTILDKPINFVPVSREIFAETSKGITLHDFKVEFGGTLSVSTKVELNQINALLLESSELYSKLNTKISRHFYMGLDEADRFKQFLYFFLFIERYTHHVFKNIDHDKHSKEFINVPSRLKKSTLKFIKERQLDSKSLSQRFHWCSLFIWKNITDEDIKKFKKIKQARDLISHGENIKNSAASDRV